MQIFGANLFRLCFQIGTKLPIRRGPIIKATQQRLKIKRCPPDKQNATISLTNFFKAIVYVPQILSDTKINIGIHHIDQMMRDYFPLPQGGLGGADIHVFVDLAAIGVDDLATESPAQLNRKRRLAHGGGANDGYEW